MQTGFEGGTLVLSLSWMKRNVGDRCDPFDVLLLGLPALSKKGFPIRKMKKSRKCVMHVSAFPSVIITGSDTVAVSSWCYRRQSVKLVVLLGSLEFNVSKPRGGVT